MNISFIENIVEIREQHGCQDRRARRGTVQGAAGQAGHDVRAADGEGEVGVSNPLSAYTAGVV